MHATGPSLLSLHLCRALYFGTAKLAGTWPYKASTPTLLLNPFLHRGNSNKGALRQGDLPYTP